jgi:serine/threonine protein kinase
VLACSSPARQTIYRVSLVLNHHVSLQPGTWVTPTVRLIRQLQEGGMGSVWAAADMRLHTQVAVKFLSPSLVSDANTRARFDREGMLARQIESPHLVHTYETGVLPDSTPYIVMEWLEGESLKERLAYERRLWPRATASVTSQLCKALGKAHELGVVHRDVKPANVFVLRSERDILVKLLDFGIAKRMRIGDDNVITETNETLGTPAYMSPEQLRHASRVDHRADIWSIAVITYRMLLGANPFRAPDYPAMCLAICEGAYTPPSELDPRWPRDLDAWFVRSFRLDREKRFHSTEEAAAALALALSPLGDTQPAGVERPSAASGPGPPSSSMQPAPSSSSDDSFEPSWEREEDDKTIPRG